MAPIRANAFMRHKVEQFERQRDNGGAFLDWGAPMPSRKRSNQVSRPIRSVCKRLLCISGIGGILPL
jgi:hypothetical protein